MGMLKAGSYIYKRGRQMSKGAYPWQSPDGDVAHIVVRVNDAGLLFTACNRRFMPQNVREDVQGDKPVCRVCDAL